MKRLATVKYWLLGTCCVLSAGSMRAQSGGITIIDGKMDKKYTKTAILYRVSEGTMVEYASETLDTSGEFAFAVPKLREGFYYLGDNLGYRTIPVRMYLKPGDQVHVSVTDEGYSASVPSEEGKVLEQWQQLLAPIAKPAYEFWTDREGYVTYFPLLESFLPKAAAFKTGINTKNEAFNQYMRWLVDNDVEAAALNFLETPRVAHPTKEEWIPYYTYIVQADKYHSTEVLRLGDGSRRIFGYAQFTHWMDTTKGRDYLKEQIESLHNDTLKGVLLIDDVRGLGRTLEKAQAAAAPYTQYLVTDSLRSKFNRYMAAMANYSQGEKAFEFKFPDTKGNMVGLSDFKGKVVYIDMWATWCGPCKRELPDLKKLEESYKGNSKIAFVSISIDEAKDTQKWLDFVKDQQLGGTQLHANGWENEFAKYYKITGIPRFLLIDDKGNLITADAPRPSESDIKLAIEKALSNVKS